MRLRAEQGVGDLVTGHVLGVKPGDSLAGGRYVVGPLLGRGGMAEVRRATDTLLHREVAVKMFRHDLDEGSAERVRTETRTLAAMCHPGLVALHDAGTTTDADGVSQPYLVMELVEGPTLASAGVLTPDRVTQVGRAIAEALAYVHAQGVIHRDVKPANILLSPSGAKLADFGIARVLDGARHTGTGLTVGTAPFLSPEQVAGEGVGPASDVYALGLVLLESLTGTREYDGPPVEAALARLNRQPYVPPTLPAPWPALLTSMTARDPDKRPSATDVAAVLGGEPLVNLVPTVAMRLPVASPTRHVPLRGAPTRLLPTRTARTPWWLAHGPAPVLGLVGLLGLIAVLLVGADSPSPERTTPTVKPVEVTTPSPTAVPARVVVAPTKAPVTPQPESERDKKGHGRDKEDKDD